MGRGRLEEAELGEGLFEFGDGRFGCVHERGSDICAEAALEGECCFDGCWVGFDEEILEQLVEAFVNSASGGEVIGEGEVHEFDDLCGDEVGGDADDSDCAGGDEGEGEAIVTGEDLEGTGKCSSELGDAVDIAAGFFDGDDVGALFSEARYGFDADLDSATAGDAVEHDWQFCCVGDGAEVLEQSLLGGAVVVGGDDESGVGSALFCLVGEGDGLGGGVRSGAGHDDAASFGLLDGVFNHAKVFFVGEGG